MYNKNTPLLFLIFNRPGKTQQVFEEIRKAKPRQLFVAADGPRESIAGEADKCQDTRKIIEQVDWDCEVATLFRDKNLGCGKAVSSAIDWFFGYVAEGIILEDDCLPNQSFFYFCQEMLELYREDTRVMHISGSNFQFGQTWSDGTYYFSRMVNVWGWASWRRAWQHYDFSLSAFPAFEKQNLIKYFSPVTEVKNRYLKKFFRRTYQKEYDNWDPQWLFAVYIHHGLCVVPNVNLISNIGYGEDATEFSDEKHMAVGQALQGIDQIIPPTFMLPSIDADIFYLKEVFGLPSLPIRIVNKLQRKLI